MLVDETEIKVQAGNGGDGVVSFRHEKYVPHGGPDGGDGGKGGNIILRADSQINTLFEYSRKKIWQAPHGEHGKNKNKHGKNGEDLILKVPKGTIIYSIVKFKSQNYEFKKKKIADFVKNHQSIVICKGGRGGLGNDHFKSSINQTPREFTHGRKGEVKNLVLEIRMIADVGLIGLPNAGKSTLLSRISEARPKIANYPFTTLEPNLGKVDHKEKRFFVADIPGLIEGASSGKGLGHKFLRHIKRTKILVHLIDINTANLKKDYQTIREELGKFDGSLLNKKEIIVLAKADTKTSEEITAIYTKFKNDLKNFSSEIIPISAVTGSGVDKLLDSITKSLFKISSDNLN